MVTDPDSLLGLSFVREVLVNRSFAFTPTMSGGQAPYAWGLAGGHLPPGVALNAATGRLSGAPSVTGAFPLSISITDAAVFAVVLMGDGMGDTDGDGLPDRFENAHGLDVNVDDADGDADANKQWQDDTPSAALPSAFDETGADLRAVFPPPVEPGNLSDTPDRPALPLVEMPDPLLAAGDGTGASPDDGVVQDTGEFIDVDDPQAYIVHLNARPDAGTAQDTGEFIDVENPSVYAGSGSPPRDTGESVDVDDPQAYAAYWDGQSDGVVHDTGEFVAVDAGQMP